MHTQYTIVLSVHIMWFTFFIFLPRAVGWQIWGAGPHVLFLAIIKFPIVPKLGGPPEGGLARDVVLAVGQLGHVTKTSAAESLKSFSSHFRYQPALMYKISCRLWSFDMRLIHVPNQPTSSTKHQPWLEPAQQSPKSHPGEAAYHVSSFLSVETFHFMAICVVCLLGMDVDDD